MRQQTSCLYFYQKRVYQNGDPVFLEDGKTVRTNDNYISFLQVISAYWDIDEQGKNKLNVFLNGGSISRDRESGALTSKAGYTVTLPEFLGKAFIEQFYNWSTKFGLGVSPTVHAVRETTERNTPRSPGRSVREEEFVDPDQESGEAVWAEPA